MPPGAPRVPVTPAARADATRYKPVRGEVPRVAGRPLSASPDRRQAEVLAEVEAVAPGERREPGTHRPRRGIAAWSIEVAWLRDQRGLSWVEIAELLEYADWKMAHPECSRGAERRVSQGRGLLHDLGAWPWALCERGVLPARWWEQEAFARALEEWVCDALHQPLSDVLRAVETVNPAVLEGPSWEGARCTLAAAFGSPKHRDAA